MATSPQLRGGGCQGSREKSCQVHFDLRAQLESLETILLQTLSLVKESINHRRSPISRMPVEILGLVFRYAIGRRKRGIHRNGFEVSNHVQLMTNRWRIGLVCRRWRAVSTSILSLWTIIDESWSTPSFLHRSGDMPLDVLLHLKGRAPHGQSLGAYAYRIGDLFIDTAGGPLISLLSYDLPRLKSLTLMGEICCASERRAVRSRKTLRIVSPNLKVLILREVQCLPSVPYNRLTHLSINDVRMRTPRMFLALLTPCTSLERLILYNVDFFKLESHLSNDVVVLQNLKLFTLGITDCDLQSTRMVLQNLIFPPTITMRISINANAARDLLMLDPFPTFPFTTTCSELSINSDDSHITLFLSSPAPNTPSLRLHFYLGFYPLAASMLSALIPFPSLERITYRTSHFPEHGDFVLSLLSGATGHDMPRLHALRLIDEYNDWPDPEFEVFPRAAHRILAEQPPFVLRELDVRSPHAKFLTLLDLPACGGTLERAAFHRTVFDPPTPDRALDTEAGRKIAEQVAEQVPYLTLHGLDEPLPRLVLPGIDGLEDDYGFY